MSSVGAYLRGLREQQGMSVDELSRATRVLSHYLEALESDELRALPAPVFTKGFIRAYCQAVGVAPDEALRLYDRIGVPAPDLSKVPAHAARIASLPEIPHRQVIHEPPDYLPATPAGLPLQGEPRESRGRGTVLISFILLVVLGAAFFAVTLALQSGREGDGERSAQVVLPQIPATTETQAVAPAPPSAPAESPAPQPPVTTQPAKPSPSGAPNAPASSAPASSFQPAPGVQAAPSGPAAPNAPAPAAAITTTTPKAQAAPSATAAPPAAAPAQVAASAPGPRGLASPYRLIARTTETTWMRVRTEDGRTSEETIPANEIREWISNGPFVITIGNAGGVSLELNGRPVPRLGASGSVITRFVLPSDNQ
jgi:cytoskeleton protein RodZ